MPENKKDSFTFSDKIKNSKPAFNPFSKRASSKIGSNGKPKKTLFERTKRDAPFFVAAAAALLMLPFLYKYSGSMNEEPIIPPGSEDTIFDPERFGYEPSVEDPNGQIAQLTGRDPFSLIKGWGSEDEAADEALPPYEDFSDSRDGLEDTYTPPESNSYRQTVPPATRAAFQRQATKINELGDASMTRASGGGAGFGRFGGANLKAAAKEDSSGGPRQGTKPVSLQPLRAADSPSRSYFGQSGAAQARASRDALSKANAAQALRDAMFTPVETGRLGGIGSGEYTPPGGSGKMEHVIDYKGITPWWWDMMKERSQKAWEWRYFLWRKNLVEPLVQALANLAVGAGCCLATGTDDCSMGSFLGRKEGYGKEPTCCGEKESKIAGVIKQETGLDWGKEACDNYKQALKTKYGRDCPGGWDGGTKGGQNLNFWEVRVDCLSNGAFGNGSNKNAPAQLKDRFNCEAVDTTRNFELQASGKALGWHKYHLVVAKNYAPFQGAKNLCNAPVINYNKQSGSGIGENEAKRGKKEIREATTASRSAQGYNETAVNLIKENMNDGCVIYVAEGSVFDWNKFQVQVKSLLTQLYPQRSQAEYDKAFANLRLYFIEGLAMKDTLSSGSVKVGEGKVKVKGMPVDRLPMTYVDFETNFILHRGNSSSDTDKFKEKKRNYNETYTGVDGSTRTQLTDGKEDAQRTACMFSDFQIKAVSIENPSVLESVLTFNPNVYGNAGNQLNVVMDVYDLNNKPLFSQKIAPEQRKVTGDGRVSIAYHPTEDQLKQMSNVKEVDVRWKASYGEKVSQDNTGYSPVPPQPATVVTPLQNTPPVTPPGPESLYGYATTFAFALEQIPQNITDRKQLTQAEIEVPATDAKNAEKSRAAIAQATRAAMAKIKTNSNVLPKDSPAYSRAKNFSCLMDAGAENLEIQSKQAKAFMDMIAAAYNDKAKANQLPQIANPRPYPSVANLVDAMHMAETLAEGKVPKAAVCQMGLLLGTVSKDLSVKSGYKDKKGSEYNNTFGAFASYIGMEASYFPSGLADDSTLPGEANPRFLANYNTDSAYHWGGYNNSRGPKSRFVSEMQSRQKNGHFPLEDLSLLTGSDALRTPPGNQDGINYNRKLYWRVYSPVWENGCDNAYGEDTMNVEDALTYLEMLCQNGLDSKPKGNGYQSDYAGSPSSTSANPGRAADTNVPTNAAQ